MTYLMTFHWGWLLASLLLGFAMGWIAVVHRGPGVSKQTSLWLAVLVAALVAAARCLPNWDSIHSTVRKLGAASRPAVAR